MAGLSLVVLFMFACAAPACAAGRAGARSLPSSPTRAFSSDMTITVRGNLTVIMNYYSQSLGGTVTVRVLLPEGYGSSGKRYPALYAAQGAGSPVFSSSGGKADAPVVISVDAGDKRWRACAPFKNPAGEGGGAAACADFFSRDIFHYMEANYRLLRGRENRAFAGEGPAGLLALYFLAQRPQLFSRAAAFSPAPDWSEEEMLEMLKTAEFAPDAKLWLSARLGADGLSGARSAPTALARLETALIAKGMRYAGNLLAYFDRGGADARQGSSRETEFALRWLFGNEDMKLSSAAAFSTARAAGVKSGPEYILFSARLKFAGGLEADYIPPAAKSSPPYFTWDGGVFRLARGAEPGTVRLYGEYEGREFSTKVRLTDSKPAAEKPKR
ncbi:MAG: alpha/beta hydrolase-fold protein [Elusimicrobiales bacterium]|nr:alpha/beta hydrolase-fold protein [Elusimicrobiales bacterium]